MLILLGTFAGSAGAGMYKCVDEHGVTHYGDSMPAQCARQAGAELDKRGVVVKKIARLPSAEELRMREEMAQSLADQQRRDTLLLSSFSNEREIDAARDRELVRVEVRASNAKALHAKRVSADQKWMEATLEEARKEADAIRAKYAAFKTRYLELKKNNAAGVALTSL
jgi:hypothetical protein